jgi:hypothetical protein
MTYVRIPVPRLTAGLVSNTLGLLGLVLMICAVGGLAGIWWAVLAAGVAGVGLSYLISAQQPLPEIEVDETGVTTRFSSISK